MTEELAEINRRYCPNFKGFEGGSAIEPEAYADFFKDGLCAFKTFAYELVYDLPSYIGRNLSSSYAPLESDSNYLGFVEEIERLYHKYSQNDKLTVPHVTRSYCGEV
jgi:hypothetical protein